VGASRTVLRARRGDCVKKTRERHAVREMKEDPSEPLCRERLQTAISCFGQKPRWLCAAEAHGKRVRNGHLNVCVSCAKDDGRPIGLSLQGRGPNQSKRRRSKGVVVSVGSKVRRKFGQVHIRETIGREPSLTRRKGKLRSKSETHYFSEISLSET
jgi:hypothetical protein